MKCSWVVLLSVAVFSLVTDQFIHARTWSDRGGRFKIEAEFESLEDGVVTLRKLDAKVVRIPLNKLSDTDQEHIRSLEKGENPFHEEKSSEPETPNKAGSKTSETVSIIGEGSGTTADEALKDAFRNAVRQVVGAVVDADTLVRNDELVEDKILTYSDGFVKSYEEVAGSKRVKGGLHQVKVKALIERRNVIAKLKAANVTVKEVDGKGLFSEAVSQLDAEQSVAAMLTKEFEEFPKSLLTAKVEGKPELVEKTGEEASVRVQIQVETDLDAYKAFTKRLVQKLEKMSSVGNEFSVQFKKQDLAPAGNDRPMSVFVPQANDFIAGQFASWMPQSFGGNPPIPKDDKITLAVATQISSSNPRLDCRYFRLDKSLQTQLAGIAFRKGTCKLSLLDEEGETVATDSFRLEEDFRPYGPPFEGTLMVASGLNLGYFYLLSGSDKNDKANALIFWVTPGFIRSHTNDVKFKPTLKIHRTVTVALQDLRATKEAKCEISFSE